MLLPILLGLGILAAVIAVILIVRAAERARATALQQTSLTLGFNFSAEGDLDQMKALGDLPLYALGYSRRVKNVLSGRSGAGEVWIFDYRYTTGGGKHSQTWEQTVALYPRAGGRMPDFVLWPENVLLDKVYQMFGYQDIDFEASPVFSARYLLRGPDEAAIRSAFTAEMRALLEQTEGWAVEVASGNVGIYRKAKRVKPKEMAAFLEQSQAVLRAIAPQ
jgi:hypothetical protein